jgi:hypothetical protein
VSAHFESRPAAQKDFAPRFWMANEAGAAVRLHQGSVAVWSGLGGRKPRFAPFRWLKFIREEKAD